MTAPGATTETALARGGRALANSALREASRILNFFGVTHPTNDPQGWLQAVSRASRQFDAYQAMSRTDPNEAPRQLKAAELGFRQLLINVGIDPSQIHLSRDPSQRKGGGIVNLEVTFDKVNGEAGVVPGKLEEPQSTPVIVVGRKAFQQGSRAALLMTVVHERAHYIHARNALTFLRKYRQSKSRLHFHEWLRAGHSKGKLIDITIAAKLYAGGSFDSQLIAVVEGFVATFHLLNLSWESPAAYKMTLMEGAQSYSRSEPEVWEEALRRLIPYVAKLPQSHHGVLCRLLAEGATQETMKQAEPFWTILQERFKC